MDPVTHAVIGMVISKMAGDGPNISGAVSAGIIIGSVFPDIDIVLRKWGNCVYLKHHRGATHSILGLAVSAAFISLVLC
ncbi:MAG: metal-dependent hydrolase [Clostridiales bacterium]|jgi:inner membrane protein|nr:metal-dependent hydrolase [Eubacteriales bacterium]MDH7567144.1 metal-dependent hydrolase [Clostridiales bacterium]